MKSARFQAAPTTDEGLFRAWTRFWFTPTAATGLHALRILSGLLFLVWLLPLAGQVENFFGLQGWFDVQAYRDLANLAERSPGAFPTTSWSALYLAGANPATLKGLYWISIGIVVLFTLGLWPRVTSVLTWIVVASFTANPVLEYEGDALLSVLAFYLMVGYLLLGQRDRDQSIWRRVLGRNAWPVSRSHHDEPSVAANLALRLLQVHFALIIVVSGLHKLQFGPWWSGVALWFPFYPPFVATLTQARANFGQGELVLGVLSLAAYLALAWQIGFPLYAWRPRWRLVLLGGAAVSWFAAAWLYRLPLLGPALFLGCLSFLTEEDWLRLRSWLPTRSAVEPAMLETSPKRAEVALATQGEGR